ncbi:hypothetical protein ACFFHJ_10720 [Planotetraspora thailandica]|nr:hypothetical protein [Planotetraspora thailandica]
METVQEPLVLRRPYAIAGRCVRVVLLAVLLWGVLVIVVSVFPRERSAEEFWAAWNAGRVTYVIDKLDHSKLEPLADLRWSTGPLAWYHSTDLYSRYLDRPLPPRGWTEVMHRNDYESVGEWIVAAWPLRVPDEGTRRLVQIAWWITLIIMLGTKRPRLANRLAWFWLFTIGQVGALFFLVFESRPLWRGVEDPMREARPIGCFIGLCLAFISAMVIGLVNV